MKKILFTLLALVLSVGSYAQLISNKTDKKVTFGCDLFTDLQLKTNENWDARGINQGFSWAVTYNFPLGESTKHTVSLGLGMTTKNYFSYSAITNPYSTDTLNFVQLRDADGFKRYKVNPFYFDVPLEVRFRIKDAWKIGVGFRFGVRFTAKTRYVGRDDEGTAIDELELGIPNLERFAYSATLRVGYKSISLFSALQLNRVFEVGHGAPEIMPLSVGITLAPF